MLGYVGAAATKSIALGLVILPTAAFFVPIQILHPVWMVAFLVLIAVTFCLFGFIIGVWGKNFEQIQFIPMLIVTPLTFLGGAFYSLDMLGEPWRTITHFNPVVYLISGFRWSFYGTSDVGVEISLARDPRLLLPLPRHRRVDVQDRVSAEDLALLSPSGERSGAGVGGDSIPELLASIAPSPSPLRGSSSPLKGRGTVGTMTDSPDRPKTVLAAAGLFLLAPLIGEFLLGNMPITWLWTLIVLAPLYGAGALLVRETAVRLGAGWPGIFLLGLAYGIVEEAYVDQSLFNPNFLGLRLLDYGFVPSLGIGRLVDIVRARAAHDLEHGRRDRTGRGALAEPCRPPLAERVGAPGHRLDLPARLPGDLLQLPGRLHAVTGAVGRRGRRDRAARRRDRAARAATRGDAPARAGRRIRWSRVPSPSSPSRCSCSRRGRSAGCRRRPMSPSCCSFLRCRRSP